MSSKVSPTVLFEQQGSFTGPGDNNGSAIQLPHVHGAIYLNWVKGAPANTVTVRIQGRSDSTNAWADLKTRGNAQAVLISSAASTSGWFAPWDTGSGAAGTMMLPMKEVRVVVNLDTGNGDGDTRCTVEFHPYIP